MPLAEEGRSVIRTVKSEDKGKFSFPLLGLCLELLPDVKTMGHLGSEGGPVAESCSSNALMMSLLLSHVPPPWVTVSCSAPLAWVGLARVFTDVRLCFPHQAQLPAFLNPLLLAGVLLQVLSSEMGRV